MDVRTQRNETKSSDEYYTPKDLMDKLGTFDTDPCSPIERPFDTARIHYTKEDDGLTKDWEGVVWLNPPYSKPLLDGFVRKLADHNNGMALLVNRTDNLLFYNIIFQKAKSMFVLRKRIKFLTPDGKTKSPMFGSVLVAFGDECDNRLRNLKIEGKYIKLN